MKNNFKNIILLGEIHGTEGNLWALQTLIDELDVEHPKITIALELPTSWNSALLKLSNGDEEELLELMTYSEELESGRISKTHIQKYLELAKQRVKFVAIRENNEDWNTTDKIMAENILMVSKSADTVIATLGNLHIQKVESVAMWDREYTCHPVGELLKDSSTSILLQYKDTKYINFGTIGEINNAKCIKCDDRVGEFTLSDKSRHDFSLCVYNAGSV